MYLMCPKCRTEGWSTVCPTKQERKEGYKFHEEWDYYAGDDYVNYICCNCKYEGSPDEFEKEGIFSLKG